MLERIGEFLYKRAINRFRSTNLHKIRDGHFDNLRTVGIVFDASREKDLKALAKFKHDLQQRDREVQVLGFFPTKDEVGHQSFGYFTEEHVNFAKLPKSEIVKQFIARPFDVLINMDASGHKPVNFVCAASQALFKIGPATANPAHYDLMIDLKDNFHAKHYIENIRTTFSQIN